MKRNLTSAALLSAGALIVIAMFAARHHPRLESTPDVRRDTASNSTAPREAAPRLEETGQPRRARIPTDQHALSVAGAATEDLQIDLVGVVVDALSGEPVPRFRVLLRATEDSGMTDLDLEDPTRSFLRSDRAGRFTIADLTAGTYTLVVDPEPSGRERCIIHDVTLPRAQPVIVRVGRGAHVEGYALDAHGRPVPGVVVTLLVSSTEAEDEPADSPSVTTDREGRYLFTRIPAGRYCLAARSRETDSACFTIDENTRVEKDLQLDAAHAVRVSIVDSAGSPLPATDVLLAGRTVQRTLRTDSNGEAWFGALVPERYAIRARKQGYRSEMTDVDLVAGDLDLPLRMKSGGR